MSRWRKDEEEKEEGKRKARRKRGGDVRLASAPLLVLPFSPRFIQALLGGELLTANKLIRDKTSKGTN